MHCSLCGGNTKPSRVYDGYQYHICPDCDFLFTPYNPEKMTYSSDYWEMESAEAARREREDCCMRAAELIFLSKIKIEKILDFGCGLGITVNWLKEKFSLDAYGIDKYGQFAPSEYLFREDILTTKKLEAASFDAIYSIEVVEHLPQDMILPVFRKLTDLLKPGGMMLINTGTLEYIEESGDTAYIDPAKRGHISIFSKKAFRKIADMLGLVHMPFWSRKWCTLLIKPLDKVETNISAWKYLQPNFELLKRLDPTYPYFVRSQIWADELSSGYPILFYERVKSWWKRKRAS
jgi:SAM-dependent methyltransferase